MISWIFLLGMNEVWEFDWISDEEDWCVISCHVPISLLSIEFNSEALILIYCLPLGSRYVSGAPFYPATVENLVKMGVTFPTDSNTFALVYFVTSWVTLK